MSSNTSSVLEGDVEAVVLDGLDGLDEAGLLGVVGRVLERLSEAGLAEAVGLAVGRLGDGGLLDVADRVVGRLAGMPLSGAVEDAALAASVGRLGVLERRVAGEKLRRVGEVDRRRAYPAAGHASAEELLAAGRALTRGEARAQAGVARALERLPLTAGRVASGELGVGQAQVAARALGQMPSGLDPADRADAVNELDEIVADAAGRSDRRRLGQRVDAWADALDEQLIAGREQRAWERRDAAALRERDGSTTWRLRLDPVGAAKVKAMVEPLARRDGPGDARTRGQRLADAFVIAAERLLDGGALPEVAAQRPHVVMVTNRPALEGQAGADASSLDGVGIVSSAAARMIACDGEVTEVVVDERGVPLVVREPSKPTRRQRAAVIARDGGCVGCGAAVARCELHHVRWRRHRGATVVANLVLVCWGCHRDIHHRGWQVAKRDGRYHLAEPGPVPGTAPGTASRRRPGTAARTRHRRAG